MKKITQTVMGYFALLLTLFLAVPSAMNAQQSVTLWEEDWQTGTADTKPSDFNSMYSQTDDKTRIYKENLATGTTPELILQKNDTWTVSNIDLQSVTGELTLTFKSNNTSTSVKANGESVTLTTDGKVRTGTITIADGTSTVTLAFTASKNSRLDDLSLTGVKQVAAGTFEFDQDAASAVYGEDFTPPTLTNTTESQDVTYSSTNENVATVDATDGTVTLVASGTTTIKAQLTSDASKTASYTLTVSKGVPTLTFPEASYSVDFGNTITLAASSSNSNGAITYSAPNGDYTLEAETGKFTAGTTAGYVTVTATLAETPQYEGATATANVEIVDPSIVVYEDVLEANEFFANTGSTYKSGTYTSSNGITYAAYFANNNNRFQLRSSISSDKTYYSGIVVSGNQNGYKLKSIQIEWDSETSSSRVLDIYRSKTTLTSPNDLYNLQAGTDEVLKVGSLAYANNEIAFNATDNYSYTGIRSNSGALYLSKVTFVWEKVADTTLEITSAGYASFYGANAFVMPENVTGGVVTAAEGNKLAIDYCYPAGSIVPAKTAILIKGTAGQYTAEGTTAEGYAPAANLLHGADAVDADGNVNVAPAVESNTVRYYTLSYDQSGNNLGFYYMLDDGAAFPYQAGKAFLAIESESGVQPAAEFVLDAAVTGIDTLPTATDKAAVYTLSGVKVSNSANLPAGVYIKGGKKVLVK